MKNSQNPVARKNDLVVQEVTDEVLVYDLSSNKAHCLNQTAAMVWKSCDGTNSVTDIARLVGSEAGGHISEDVVWLAIDQLNESDLLEQELRSSFAGQSRREVIKKIGLASMIGLPIIASLVAPSNVLAVGSCSCTSTAQCASQTGCQNLLNCNCAGRCADPVVCPGQTERPTSTDSR
ncbi:MAG: PqqD family protein [Saprospiraceae bacterium]|nr:PqqD family protein [Pyrinomonadaceae bacterium]